MSKEASTRHKWVMVIDSSKCVGCCACIIACQNQNALAPGECYNRLEEKELGALTSFRREIMPVQCQHCDSPPCVAVCPVGASFKREDGVVMVDERTCIGCKYCILSCPYNVRLVRKSEGHVHKCSFCIEHVEKGGAPACVSTCPTGVRAFGDVNDPDSRVSKLIASRKTSVLMKDQKTNPSVFYIVTEKVK